VCVCVCVTRGGVCVYALLLCSWWCATRGGLVVVVIMWLKYYFYNVKNFVVILSN